MKEMVYNVISVRMIIVSINHFEETYYVFLISDS